MAHSPAATPGANTGFYTVTAGGSSLPTAQYAGQSQYGGSGHDVPLATGSIDGSVAESLPTAADQPAFEPGTRDLWAAVLFWVHALVIVILAFALGVPAMKADAAAGDNNTQRQTLDFSASLFVRMIVLATFVGGVVSAGFFQVLRRYGGGLIRCALYTSAVLQLIMACITFAFAPVAGVFLLIGAGLTFLYIYYVRARIPFAAAHLQTACDAVSQYKSLFFVALLMLAVQGLWILFWAMASLGIQHKLNANAGTAVGNGGSGSANQQGNSSGGIVVFFLLVSFYWGAQVFKNVVHFVTASVVGNWWFLGTPHAAVHGSLTRAFTSSFGSIAFGSLLVAVIRALEVMARNAESRARRSRNGAAELAACCAACLLQLLRRIVEYVNSYAYVYCALTGIKFTDGAREAMNLFRKRGWTQIINDDLTGTAFGIVCLMVGAVSGVIGGGTAYVFMGGAHNGTVAGIVAFLCFLTGFAMASVMTALLTSGVRTVFVCFALNPSALGATHPTHLAALCNAWQLAHPQTFASCGYTAAYAAAPGGGPMGGPGGGGGSVSVGQPVGSGSAGYGGYPSSGYASGGYGAAPYSGAAVGAAPGAAPGSGYQQHYPLPGSGVPHQQY